MQAARGIKGAGAGLVLLALGACAQAVVPPDPVPKPVARPAASAPAPVAASRVAQPTSQASAELRSYLLQLQTAQLGQGLLRRDGGGADTPFTRTMLARNFEQIAFFSEYDGGFSTAGGPSPLRRWGGPVHMEMIFGSSVPPSQRASDTANVRSFADRLARVTGHPVSMGRKPNFVVIVAGEDDRGAALAQAAAQLPGVTATSLEPLANLPRNSYCVVVTYSTGIGDNTYTAAIALIRAENPNFLRLSCIHEELAQGMGLANDSPAARPSIFNDDDEFALLTRHDELLLKMLYDPRLRPGMSADEARETVQTIAGELTNAGPV